MKATTDRITFASSMFITPASPVPPRVVARVDESGWRWINDDDADEPEASEQPRPALFKGPTAPLYLALAGTWASLSAVILALWALPL